MRQPPLPLALPLAGLAGLLSACGGGSGHVLVWDVPPLISPLTAGGVNNAEPPPEILAPEFVLRSEVEPVAPTREEQAALEADALALARAHLAATGVGAMADVAVTHFETDEFGSHHVKMEQLHDGVPVLGGGAIAHLYPDRPHGVTDNLVAGITTSTTPRVAQADALATAMAAYGPSALPLDATQRLAIQPHGTLVRTGSAFPQDHTDDFALQLDSADLVYDITIGPEVPDDEALLLAVLDTTTPNTEPDDEALRVARAENATHGGHEPPEVTSNGPLAFLSEPAVRYLVDATTGVILSSQILIDEGGLLDDLEPGKGTGYSYFSGTVDLDTVYYPAMDFHVLIDCARPTDGVGNVTYDGANQETYGANDMYFLADGNDSWGDGSIQGAELQANFTKTRRQTPAVDVAYGMQLTWDFLQNVVSRDGPDGDGTSVKACSHWGDGYTDARYERNSKFIVFGDGATTSSPGLYQPIFVGHELGHRFWHHAGIASVPGESSAMNEGHGDIQGSLVEFYRTTQNGTGSRLRRTGNFGNWMTRLRDPDGYSEPDGQGGTVSGYTYWDSTLKDGKEHVGGIPFGRAMIYLAEGAPSDPADTLYTTEWPNGLGGIGLHKAARIWKTAVAHYVAGTPAYWNMRAAFHDAASYLYGNDSMEVRAVQRAFAGIRVGQKANDTQGPTISYAQFHAVDLKDMTALVHVVAKDDTGIREMRIDGHDNNGTYDTRDVLTGYVNIARMPLGNQSFTIEVEDSAGKTTSVVRSLKKGLDRNLIRNGDFEDPLDAATNWTNTSGKNRAQVDQGRAFIGGYLAMADVETVWQEVTIPAAAKDVCLVYRILIRDSVTSNDGLDVQVLGTDGAVLKVLASYSAGTPRTGRS
jgi:Zn-dependent metalloprotease